MGIVTKEDIIYAFKQKMRKRNILLYEFYKDKYFNKRYPYKFIAEKLSEELEVRVTVGMVTQIFYRYAKNTTSKGNDITNKASLHVTESEVKSQQKFRWSDGVSDSRAAILDGLKHL